ncbi:hypothetical protein HanRHA438_Chr09g0387581 [Helianthus annuus]|nr:hypothetical protein HanRHA438_Chr09g0387581 [Helianthus annuus]
MDCVLKMKNPRSVKSDLGDFVVREKSMRVLSVDLFIVDLVVEWN